jgi:AraC family transcriptional regulator of adaptative response/methylated-DNA-[protein]-cysteine methyltransferase
MKQLSRQTMIEAMRRNDAAYDGRFFVGVHSTGIYCLPSCKAKLPLLKNVVFYPTREEAIAAGLRGCQRCRSEHYPDVLPGWLKKVLWLMYNSRTERLTEERLRTIAGVDITTIRRHFHEQLGLSPLAFHRKLRLDYARRLLETGSDYLAAAYECGYQSASGFREAFIRQFGRPPGRFYARS